MLIIELKPACESSASARGRLCSADESALNTVNEPTTTMSTSTSWRTERESPGAYVSPT